MSTEPASQYSHISYTPSDTESRIDALIEASHHWTPVQGRIIKNFDTRAFTEALLAEVPATSSHPHEDRADAVLRVLADQLFFKGAPEHLSPSSGDVVNKIRDAVAYDRPLEIVIPSFPGRPSSPITHLRMEPDISELYAFALLARIDKAVKYIYPPGVHFTIILDGKAYDPFYGYTPEADAAYPDYLAGLVSSAGLSSVISMIDLADMVAARRPEFDALKPKVEARLVHNWRDPSFALREELLHTMRLGSNTYSVNAAAVELAKYSDKYSDNEIVSLVRRMSSAVADRARETAFEYMVFLTVIKEMRLISERFPTAVRGTVHPKPGQYAPRLTHPSVHIAPWHGVGILLPDGHVNSVYEAHVWANPQGFRGVYLAGEYTPFFYEQI